MNHFPRALRAVQLAAAVALLGLAGSCWAAADAKSEAKTETKAAAAPAPAAGSCEDKAIDKNGKKLAGAAKAASMKKCEADAKGAK